MPEGIKSVEVNGYPMAYRESGRGRPLILVHGVLNDYRYWNPQIEPFAAHYRTIAVSLRHYYPEPWDGRGDDFSILQHADDVGEFIRRLHLEPVHLLGHSRGGAVVLHVAARYPELIKTLILADAAGLEELLPDTPEGRAMAAERQANAERLAADLANGDRDAALRVYIDALSGPGRWDEISPEQKLIHLDNAVPSIRTEPRPSLPPEAIGKFRFPILPIVGERSPKRFAETLRAMRLCLPDNTEERIIIPDAAHGMNRQNPKAFNAAVLGFLSHQTV
ncbi:MULTISPECIES: alpha/beta fold hydrolase [unclassified Bradyrhizobium]